MIIPPLFHRVNKCNRCGLLYPKRMTQCSHCKDLTDREVEDLKAQYEEEHKGNANLGRLFIYIAILILLGLAIINKS